MKKNVKRINESQLRAIVAESVKKVLYEQEQPTLAIISIVQEHFIRNMVAMDLSLKKMVNGNMET